MPTRHRPTVALVTCAAYPELSPDDRLLLPALEAAGWRPAPRIWDAPGEPWEAHAAVVVRSCWDYHHRPGEFHRWLDRLDACGARVLNAVPTIRWNSDKTYLRDLATAGVPVVPTVWVTEGAGDSLARLVRGQGWSQVVVKPTVSATAYETWRAGPVIAPADELRFAGLVRQRGVMVQPFLPGIGQGELSFIFLGGRFSHAVLKRPRPGEFRVQIDYGGTVEPARPDPLLVEQAERVVAAAPEPPLYARVDGCVVDGRFLLMELELIEPALFFQPEPAAAGRLVEALEERLSRGGSVAG